MARASLAPLPDSRFAPWIPARLRANRLVALVLLWDARWRMRRALAELPDHLLADIGRSRTELAREIAKPVWRA